MQTHEYYMRRTLELAKQGWGRTNPNPLVGAVIVKDGSIIAEGFHEALGCAHAEVMAIRNATGDIRGGTVYVNLEPCSHYGRTPPCAKALIEAGIKEVVVAMEDPNPRVAGRGIQLLRDAGIKVIAGVLEQEARTLNEIFIKYITTNRPFVIMKTAMTLDGKIASCTGDSKWISGEVSRQYVHTLRDRVAAIMVGVNTLLKDNPSLTTRLDTRSLEINNRDYGFAAPCMNPMKGPQKSPGNLFQTTKKGKDPIRIIVDSTGRIPLDCRAITGSSDSGVMVATTSRMDKEKEKCLMEKGVVILQCDGEDGRVNLLKLMEELHRREVDSVLLEGGGEVNASALEMKVVDKVVAFIAPKIIGGRQSPTPVGGEGIQWMREAIRLKDIKVTTMGEDIRVEGYVRGE